MSYARKVDLTHKSIRQALRQCGCEVIDTSHARDFVDLVALKGGRLYLIEAKTPQNKAGRIEKTASQQALEDRGFPITYLASVEEAIRWATTRHGSQPPEDVTT